MLDAALESVTRLYAALRDSDFFAESITAVFACTDRTLVSARKRTHPCTQKIVLCSVILSGSEMPARMKDELSDDPSATRTRAPQRRFPRYRFDVRMQVTVFREGVMTELWGRTNEVGLDGIGATLTGELKAGEVVSLEFPIPLRPLAMKVRALVRYGEGLRYGFEFLIVTGEQKESMRRLCEMLANAS